MTWRFSHRLDEKGNENKELPAKEGSSRALSSFMSNIEDQGDDDEDFANDHTHNNDNEE